MMVCLWKGIWQKYKSLLNFDNYHDYLLINNKVDIYTFYLSLQVGFHQACHTPYHHLLLSLVYTVFLIVVVAVLAVKSRGIRDNYREATFIGLAVACVIPVWLGWALCGLVCGPLVVNQSLTIFKYSLSYSNNSPLVHTTNLTLVFMIATKQYAT